ncbi:MAG: hypothetical protein JJ863_35420 [Deltaproteobacteria bacterium]|nr:hypothetical protein [Deltaproteobacteria bacterium]
MGKRRRIRGPKVTTETHHQRLRRRAHKHARKGNFRKAVVALRELTALDGRPAHWVALGDALRRARKEREAIRALKQGLFLHSRAGADARARSVAQLILELDPTDRVAERQLERAGVCP